MVPRRGRPESGSAPMELSRRQMRPHLAQHRHMSLLSALLLLAVLPPGAGAFDPAVALSLTYLEKAVYCGERQFESWDVGDSLLFGPRALGPPFLRFVRSAKTKAHAGVGRLLEPEGCFVAIQGTQSSAESLLDSMFWMTDFDPHVCKGCKVDFGFHEHYESIKEGIFQALHEFDCRPRDVYLVGHSLGAADVQFLLYHALNRGFRVRVAYALESPRPGNAAFASALAEKVQQHGVDAVRVTHYKDMVPHLPPKKLYYRHALPEIYYKTEHGHDYELCKEEDVLCSDQWSDLRQFRPSDHTWFLNINPCWCQNDTKTSVAAAAAWREELSSACFQVFDEMAGDITCGWHIFGLVTKGRTARAAAAQVARDYPRRCGRCLAATGRSQDLVFMLGSVAILVVLLALLLRRRGGRARPERGSAAKAPRGVAYKPFEVEVEGAPEAAE